jgi:hypothetical protein
MTRQLYSAAIIISLAIAPLAAQAPQGWMLRSDASTSAADPDAPGAIKFTATPSGFHATTPQAAVFWHPSNTATGAYSLKASFTLVKPSGHTNFYGLVFGGRDLAGAGQSYFYFLVAQDGTWLLKRRVGNDKTDDIVTKTAHAAVKKPDQAGTSTNVLEVRVLPDSLEYMVNGTVVHKMPKSALQASTDGLYGLRMNHQLEVRVDNLTRTTL